MHKMSALLFTLVLLCGVNALAHKDTPIELTRGGDLKGLPEQYQPARLLIPQDDHGKVTLQLGKVSTTFPECVSQFFRRAQREHVLRTGFPSNFGLNPTVGPVTALAQGSKRRVSRPARYRGR